MEEKHEFDVSLVDLNLKWTFHYSAIDIFIPSKRHSRWSSRNSIPSCFIAYTDRVYIFHRCYSYPITRVLEDSSPIFNPRADSTFHLANHRVQFEVNAFPVFFEYSPRSFQPIRNVCRPRNDSRCITSKYYARTNLARV